MRLDTKGTILDAAERLFTERGFGAVSLRDITAAAGVNLAAVNYHFGSKDALIVELFVLRASAINRERNALLLAAEQRAAGPPALREVLRALLDPPLRWWLGDDPAKSTSARFIARAIAEGAPEIRATMESQVGHLQRFVIALARTLPQLSHAELCWRLHFTTGLMHYTIGDRKRLDALSLGACDYADVEAVIERMVEFSAAGFEAPAQHEARPPLAVPAGRLAHELLKGPRP